MPDILKKIKLRLNNASLSEIVHRILTFARYRLVTFLVCKVGFRPPLPPASQAAVDSFILPEPGDIPDKKTVHRIMQGERFTLNFPDKVIKDFEIKWSKRCVTAVPFGEKEKDVDIRAVWEAGRLQHITLVSMYVQYAEDPSGVEDCINWIKKELFKWLDDNPFLHGPHYQSAMECGLRIISFLYAARALWNHVTDRERNRITAAIYTHAWLVSQRLSLYSSLGNHTVCECVGLATAALLVKDTKNGTAWFEEAEKLLIQEAERQILKDGGPAERSVNYHRFVIDLFIWISELFRLNNHEEAAKKLQPAVKRGGKFWQILESRFIDIPAMGDSDDGYAIAPGIAPCRKRYAVSHEPAVTFEQTGFSIIGGGKGLEVGFDHGALGMPPLYNHGHADALSVTLNVKGRQILIDPGTYRYNNLPNWRKYFKGTRAHNTVTVDHLDQAVQQTGFIWSDPYHVSLVKKDIRRNRFFHIAAVHDGYERLREPVTHRRDLAGDYRGRLIIIDTFEGRGKHTFELNFHLHPEVQLSEKENYYVLARDDILLGITFLMNTPPVKISQSPYEKSVAEGWFSPAYNIKIPTKIIRCSVENATPSSVSFFTAISYMTSVQDLPQSDTFMKIMDAINLQLHENNSIF